MAIKNALEMRSTTRQHTRGSRKSIQPPEKTEASAPKVHPQYAYSAPTLHLHYSTCLAPDRAPVGKDNARAAARDALPDVHEHLFGRLRDERAHEGAPVAHDRAARRVARVAAVTSQESVIASSPLYQVYQLQSFKSQCPQCMSRLIKSVFLAFQEYSRLFFVQFKCISIVTESIFRVCLNVQCQWRSRVPVQRTHAFLPARVLAHDLRQLLLDPGPDVLSGPVVAQPARGLRGCGGGTPTSKSCEVMSKCRMQCNKMASANATPSPESVLTRLPSPGYLDPRPPLCDHGVLRPAAAEEEADGLPAHECVEVRHALREGGAHVRLQDVGPADVAPLALQRRVVVLADAAPTRDLMHSKGRILLPNHKSCNAILPYSL